MMMLAISLLAGTVANLLIDGPSTLVAAGRLSLESWFLVVGMAIVCTVIGYSVWFIVIRECPINVAALTVFAQAIFGAGIAALWLGERLRWGQLLGCLTIVAGLVIGLSRQIERPAQNSVSVFPRAK
jgi:drug/metabolite transporter (DMT)-like permease